MAEVLVAFTEPTRSPTGDLYYGRVLGSPDSNGLWQGWIEFALAGSEEVVATARETEQPNREDLRYWAQGLSDAYLQGALDRALRPAPANIAAEVPVFTNSSPKEPLRNPTGVLSPRPVLDPFLTYTEGEGLLRKQLLALSHDHLQNIVEAYRFLDADELNWPSTASNDALVERIVGRVRERFLVSEGKGQAAEASPQNATEERPSA